MKRRETEIDDLIKVNLKTTFLHQTALTPNNIHSREKKPGLALCMQVCQLFYLNKDGKEVLKN